MVVALAKRFERRAVAAARQQEYLPLHLFTSANIGLEPVYSDETVILLKSKPASTTVSTVATKTAPTVFGEVEAN
jgi:hypothetical protein